MTIKPTTQPTTGTSFFSQTITATYNQLVKVFGEPTWDYSDDGKVSSEWELELEDGTVFTIYDWKENIPPCTLPDTSFTWHIGSFGPLSSEQHCTILETVNQ